MSDVTTGTALAAQLWCDPRTENRVLDVDLAKVAAERFDSLAEIISHAATLIAHADCDSSDMRLEWREAVEKWRERAEAALTGG